MPAMIFSGLPVAWPRSGPERSNVRPCRSGSADNQSLNKISSFRSRTALAACRGPKEEIM